MGAAAAAAVVVCASPAAGQCQYEVTSLDYPVDCGIFSVITIPTGLNNHGAVVGRYQCSIWNTVLGFLWTPEDGFATLPLPPGVNDLRADDINDAAAIVGSYSLATGGVAFVYQDGHYTEILPPPGGSCNCIWASAIDNEGTVAGRFSIGNFNQTSAYVWRPKTGLIDLGVMNGPYSAALHNGPGGYVTGWTGNVVGIHQGFIYHDGTLTIVPPIPGGVSSGAGAITADGILVGSGLMQETPGVVDPSVGFLWRAGQFLHFIDPLPGYDTSGAGHINAVRQVTGLSASITNPNDRRGYLWQHGITHDLNDLVPPGSVLIGRARAINAHGQILASGLRGQALLLTPMGRPPGDIDIDCNVGITDFLWVLGEWGRPDSPADVNEDGNVDELDLITVIENWGA